MSFIAIDLGTSFIKGAVLDLDHLRLSHIQRAPFPDPLPGLPPLHKEFSPQAVLAAARQVFQALLPFAGDCEGLVMCSQMHGRTPFQPDHLAGPACAGAAPFGQRHLF